MLLLSRLGNGPGPSVEQTEIPFTLECFVRSLVEFGEISGSAEEDF